MSPMRLPLTVTLDTYLDLLAKFVLATSTVKVTEAAGGSEEKTTSQDGALRAVPLHSNV
jgi:hypothetical protein